MTNTLAFTVRGAASFQASVATRSVVARRPVRIPRLILHKAVEEHRRTRATRFAQLEPVVVPRVWLENSAGIEDIEEVSLCVANDANRTRECGTEVSDPLLHLAFGREGRRAADRVAAKDYLRPRWPGAARNPHPQFE